MADVLEYVYLGSTAIRDNRVDWRLDDDAVESGIWAPTSVLPSRAVLVLTDVSSGDVVTIDSNASPFSLGAPGTGSETFQWAEATSILTLYFGGLDPDVLPAGNYSAALYVYSAEHPNGLRWGRQTIYFVVS